MAAATTSWTEQGRPPLGPKGNRHSERCEAFYFSLANRLEDLERSLQSKWLSLEWVALAVEFVRSTYSDVNRLLEGLKDISADANESVDDWVEEYMVESMKLLDEACRISFRTVSDVCAARPASVQQMHRRRMWRLRRQYDLACCTPKLRGRAQQDGEFSTTAIQASQGPSGRQTI
jgi:hypothetical protein